MMTWRKKKPPKKKMACCVCKECKYWLGGQYAEYGTCTHLPAHGKTIANGFCYWAEKRKGGN